MLYPQIYLQMFEATKPYQFDDAVSLLARFGFQPDDIAIALGANVSDVKRSNKRVQTDRAPSRKSVRKSSASRSRKPRGG